MRDLALASIGLYQRYISPYKGFCCAYRVHKGPACEELKRSLAKRIGLGMRAATGSR